MILLLHFRLKIFRSHGASLSLINKRPTFLRTNPWWRTSLTLAQGVVTLSRIATFCLKISMINSSQILVYIRGSNLESTNTELFPSLVTNYNCSFWFWMAIYLYFCHSRSYEYQSAKKGKQMEYYIAVVPNLRCSYV